MDCELHRLIKKVTDLPEKFNNEHKTLETQGKHQRSRKFTPKSFLWTMVALISGRGGEGYHHAIVKVFGEKIMGLFFAPSKAALSKFRKKISYKFFQDLFNRLIETFNQHRPRFKGLIIYAIDGQQLTLPRTVDIVAKGFTGRSTGKYEESYMPKGFLTHCYDVLSGVSKKLAFNPTLNENADALNFISSLEKDSLTLYDRLYFGFKLCRAHFDCENYFIMRCKSNACMAVIRLLANKNFNTTSMKLKTNLGVKKIYFIKIINPENGEENVFATNLPRSWRSEFYIQHLYGLRQEVEVSFKELTYTSKLEQWHTKFYNGIMQELYLTFWLINITKIIAYFANDQKTQDPLNYEYKKPDFKLLLDYICDKIDKVFGKIKSLIAAIRVLIKRSTERRKRMSRYYKREIKSPASPYKHNNTEWYWDKKWSFG